MKDRKVPKTQRPQQTPSPGSEIWHSLPWQTLEQQVVQLQKRIYQASQRGNMQEVHALQQQLLEAEAARLVAVRRVTEDNQGKDTPGIDGVKSLTPKEQLAMAADIHPKHWKHQRPKPVRRVWIPKPGKAEKRPLGILTMIERCKQALVKLALEAEWEAKFERNSYGFRPGRSTHDAIAAIVQALEHHPTFVFDADIEGAFDHINQAVLLDKLQTSPALRQMIEAWLKAGVMDGKTYLPSETGVPQGGALSPLLMNVALHGMEGVVTEGNAKGPTGEKPLLVRYADDFLIFHSNLEELQQTARRVTRWLAPLGFHLNTKKTQITHTLTPAQGQGGFDFLGFTIRHYSVGNAPQGKSGQSKPLVFKTSITPSQEAINRHLAAIARQLQRLHTAPQAQVIVELNPLIGGWANYYQGTVEAASLSKCDDLLWHQLMNWASQRHPGQSESRLLSRYWHRDREGKWVFATPDGAQALRTHRETTRG